MGNKLTLPVELNTNNTAYTLCSQAQADSDTCPAASKFGWATAKSPFLGEPVQGPVYLIQQTATSLPGLLLDLQGRAHVKVQTRTTLINNKRIQSLVTNAPQLPVSELTVALNGGRKTGVFQNREDLCFKGESTTKFNSVDGIVKFYGWNGKQSADTKLDATVPGCGPAVKASLKGATSSRPSLTVTATKHPDAANMKELRVSLSSNLRFVRSRLGSGGSATAAATAAKARVRQQQHAAGDRPAGRRLRKGDDPPAQRRGARELEEQALAEARAQPWLQRQGQGHAGQRQGRLDADQVPGQGPALAGRERRGPVP